MQTQDFSILFGGGGGTGPKVSTRLIIRAPGTIEPYGNFSYPTQDPIEEIPLRRISQEMKDIIQGDERITSEGAVYGVLSVVGVVLAILAVLYAFKKCSFKRCLASSISAYTASDTGRDSLVGFIRRAVQEYLIQQGWKNEVPDSETSSVVETEL